MYAGHRGAWSSARCRLLMLGYESVIAVINEFVFGVAVAAFACARERAR